jgi:hypothetical protein
MKRIGILTFARVVNFGANLQGLSTYCYFKKHGYSPIFIDWEPEDFAKRQNMEAKTIQGKAHFDFFDFFCQKTRKCRNDQDIVRVVEEEKLNAIVIGSDAVLQHHPLITRIKFPTKHLYYIEKSDSARMFPNPFWGTFKVLLERDVPLIMMSGSSQNSPYQWFSRTEKERMAECLKGFSYISVRDTWTQKMVLNITDSEINPEITPDPVFAFNQNCSELIPRKTQILNKYELPDNYVIVSLLNDKVLSKEWLSDLSSYARNSGIECVALPMPDGMKFQHDFKYEIPTPLSPIDWYALIKYSRGYIGQNMHPVVVALHNALPVYSFDTYGITRFCGMKTNDYSSKIFHILQEFECQNHRTAVNKRNYSLPSPLQVLTVMSSANRLSLQNKAVELQSKYESMMTKIVKIIDSAE